MTVTTISFLIMVIGFLLNYVTRYLLLLPQDCIVSIHCIPEYLFCYALGAFLYTAYTNRREIMQRVIVYIGCVLGSGYMVLVYFGRSEALWSWIYQFGETPLCLLPETVLLVAAFFCNLFISQFIKCDFVSKLGKNTLIMCLSESTLKLALLLAGQIIGIELNVTNAFSCVLFSIVALIICLYTAVPLTKRISTQLCLIATDLYCREKVKGIQPD